MPAILVRIVLRRTTETAIASVMNVPVAIVIRIGSGNVIVMLASNVKPGILTETETERVTADAKLALAQRVPWAAHTGHRESARPLLINGVVEYCRARRF